MAKHENTKLHIHKVEEKRKMKANTQQLYHN